jgi:hypothetical protein
MRTNQMCNWLKRERPLPYLSRGHIESALQNEGTIRLRSPIIESVSLIQPRNACRTIRLHLSSREIFDRLLIGEHTVMLKQIVHHTLAVNEGGDGSLAIAR